MPAFAPLLLEQKAEKIRADLLQDSEKGLYKEGLKPENVRSKFASPDRSPRQIFMKALTRPFSMFYHEHIIQLLGLYMAFIYGVMYRELLPLSFL